MAPERMDTDFESKLKIVEIDGTVRNMASDIFDIKACIKELTMNLSSYSNLHTMITNMQDSMNQTVKRADERWNELIRVREGQIVENNNRHKATEAFCKKHAETLAAYEGSLKTLGWVVGVLIAVLSAIGVRTFMDDDASSKAVANMIAINAQHIRALENETMARDQNFRPQTP